MIVANGVRELFRSPGVQLALDGVRAALAAPGGVLICGEPGTGRETLARAIHGAANRACAALTESMEGLLYPAPGAADVLTPFVVVDCATTREIESRLFGRFAAESGHTSLETTGADGLLYRAQRGTLFLRSVQDMPGRVQTRLARVLRDGEIWLADGSASRAVALETRVITSIDAASTSDELLLPELKKRLAVHRIDLPPLRHRREDLPALVRLLLAEICSAQGMPVKSVSPPAVALVRALPWRGNFNELRALLQTLVASVPRRTIRVADVLGHVRLDGGDLMFSTSSTLKEARGRFEREYVAAVLEQHQGRMAEAAVALGMQRPNLYRKLRQLAVPRTPAFARATSDRMVAQERGSDARKARADADSLDVL